MNEKSPDNDKEPAQDNPWYKLMTWHGEPPDVKDDVISRNRLFWHRYIYENLTEENKKHLVDNNIHTKEELQPFSEEEKKDNKQIFQSWGFNPSDYDERGMGNINFSNMIFKKGLNISQFILPVNFRCCRSEFLGKAHFEGTLFSVHVRFRATTFTKDAYFIDTTFSRLAIFERAKFTGDAHFRNATFSRLTRFKNAIFSGNANLENTTFSGNTAFDEVKFLKEIIFTKATFEKEASFKSAEFIGKVKFTRTTFVEEASFKSAKFNGPTIFTSITFEEDSMFNSTKFNKTIDFRNTKFKSTTDFTNTYFKAVPQFQGSELHVDTIWDKNPDLWPGPPDYGNNNSTKTDKKKQELEVHHPAETAERIYSSLKFQMSRVMRHDDELFFFAKELEARAVHEGKSFPYLLYKYLSNFGQSIARPGIILLVMFTIFTLAYTLTFSLTKEPSLSVVPYDLWLESLEKPFKISLVNTVPFVGLQNYVYDTDMPVCIFVLGIIQSLLSTIMLFLIGLGIRNRFRIK